MVDRIQAHYGALICGATLSGLGAALAAPEDTLVLERSGAVGQEFIEAFRPGRFDSSYALSEYGKRLADELLQRNLIASSNGPVHLPGLHPVLCKLVLDAGVEARFLTEIIEVSKHRRGYEITISNASGMQQFTAERIIDTTSRQFSNPENRYKPASKSIHAYLHTKAAAAAKPQLQDERVKLLQGRFPSELILKWSVDPQFSWSQARGSLLEYWSHRAPELQPYTIAAIASVFACEVPRGLQRIADNWSWLPSEGYAHPLEAYDQGGLYRMRGEERQLGYLKTI